MTEMWHARMVPLADRIHRSPPPVAAMRPAEHPIAKHIPVRFRRAMVAVTYHSSSASLSPSPRCRDGKCPMGFLPGIPDNAPDISQIADWLHLHGVKGAAKLSRPELMHLAYSFVHDWDEGKIKNLRTILGV